MTGLWTSRLAPRRSAFTLIELLAVIALLGVLSLTAIPAMRSVDRTRAAALAREIDRRLTLARGFALATSQPAAVSFDLNDQSIAMRRIATPDADPAPMPAATGHAMNPLAIRSAFAGAEITAMRHGDGSTGGGEVWFNELGEPMIRETDGDFTDFSQDARITVTGPRDVVVRRVTGLTQR